MDNVHDAIFSRMPLIAILRGIAPEESVEVADALMDAGFRMLEVPLNSPRPFESIARLAAHCPPEVMVGAGTVLDPSQVNRLAAMPAPLLVTPNTDVAVIQAVHRKGLFSVIGCATPSEAFTALKHGARVLKLFPAARFGPGYLRDLRAVLPAATRVAVVGGVSLQNLEAFHAAGADAFAFGSNLYRPGVAAAEVGAMARDLVAEYRRVAGAA
jgi:2-dehydro-3-deoxyphosphogalactonate aldolase